MTDKIKILLLAMLSSLAAQARSWQFAALGEAAVVTNGEAVVSWGGRDGAAITPMHDAGNGWECPVAANGAVRFSAGATPLALPESATSLVSRVFVVATATNLEERSTLLFAATSFWLAPSPYGGLTLAPAMPATGSSAAVDGVAGAPVPANGKFLAEIELGEPMPAWDVFIGGHAATPLWRRGWQGGIHEVVMLAQDATPSDAQAVRAMLAGYWRLSNAPPSPFNAQTTLNCLGLSSHGFYTTMLITL